MNTELKDAIEALEKEKNIMRETLFEAIENALLTACKNNFGKVDNIKVWVDRDTFEYFCVAEKEVVETKDDVEDDLLQIPLEEAVKIKPAIQVGDKIDVKINSQSFGRIATQIAKNVILQRIREEERSAIYDYYFSKQKSIVTGIVQRINGGSISVNLGRAEGLLNEKETVPGENLKPQDRIKVYVIDVRKTQRGPRILVSRTHPELVKKLFEQEVTEIQEGVVEIKSIAREPGSRTKIAVYSNDPKVDATESVSTISSRSSAAKRSISSTGTRTPATSFRMPFLPPRSSRFSRIRRRRQPRLSFRIISSPSQSAERARTRVLPPS